MAHAVRGVAAVMALASYHSRGASGLRGRRRMGGLATVAAAKPSKKSPSYGFFFQDGGGKAVRGVSVAGSCWHSATGEGNRESPYGFFEAPRPEQQARVWLIIP